jgi:ATP-dependent 26S proteasome regulatory subunit
VAVKALLGTSRLNPPNMVTFLDLSAHLNDPATLRAWRDALETGADLGSTMILIDHSAEAPEIVKRVSTPLRISLPGHAELEAIVREEVRIASTVDKVEARLKRSELDQLVRNLAGLTRSQARLVVREAVSDDQRLSVEDLDHVLAGKRRLLHVDGLLEFVEAPATLDGIGGMSNLKRWLKQRQLAGADEAASFGIDPPRGVMMLGVQGAGKSLCAKAIATAWKRPLLRLDPGSLYDKFIGESERRLREALLQAEAMSPIILWIDEIEKGFASASGQSNDGGLSRRMFGELLTWMQEHRAPVFLVATANDIESLPPELMRKGRFDEIFFVDLPGREARKAIFKIHLKKRKRDPGGFDLGAMVEASEGFSGAEIEQAVVTALHSAYSERAELTTERVVEALRGSPPLSVTMREKVAALRRWAEGRCVPAG